MRKALERKKKNAEIQKSGYVVKIMSEYKKAYKKLPFIKRWKLKACMNLIRLHNSMHWYIVSKGLFEDFMKFDIKFDGDVIDKIKQERRKKILES